MGTTKYNSRAMESLGVSDEGIPRICRGCLASNRRMNNALVFEALFTELTGVIVSQSDGFPKWLCYECTALLRKCVKFKHQVMKSHFTLYQHIMKSLPFPHNDDASSYLVRTNVLCCDIPGNKTDQTGEKFDCSTTYHTAIAVTPKMELVEIKEEKMDSDYEDNTTTEVYSDANPLKSTPFNMKKQTPLSEVHNIQAQSSMPHQSSGSLTASHPHTNLPSKEPESRNQFYTPLPTQSKLTEPLLESETCKPIGLIPNKLLEVKIERTNEITIEPVIKQERLDDDDEDNATTDGDFEEDDIKDDVTVKKEEYTKISNAHLLLQASGSEVYNCDKCGKSFVYKINFDHHIRLHEEIKAFQCNMCQKTFRLKSTLTEHMRIHSEDRPFHCNMCSKCFSQKSCLYRHKRIHAVGKQHTCDICTKQFYYRSSMNKHRVTHSGVKPFVCDDCKKCFTSKSDLVRHIKRHADLRPYKCKECNKTFNHRGPLTIHERIHTGEKPYKCELCGREFSDKGNLNQHLRTHSGDKPFRCEVCQRCFRTKRNLTQHAFLHKGEKPFTCKVCNKGFINERNLNQHSKLHTGIKPYKCDVCPKSFIQKIHLKNHRKSMHAISDDNTASTLSNNSKKKI